MIRGGKEGHASGSQDVEMLSQQTTNNFLANNNIPLNDYNDDLYDDEIQQAIRMSLQDRR